MGVCNAIERIVPVERPTAMSASHLPKVAGINASSRSPARAAAPLDHLPAAPGVVIQDRLAGWVSDLTTLHELTERLATTSSLNEALDELLRAGAALAGARRGLVVCEPADGLGPVTTLGLGLGPADLGQLETVPRRVSTYGRLLDGSAGTGGEAVAAADLLGDSALDPRQREVAVRLGYGASYAVPLDAAEPVNAAGPVPADGSPAAGGSLTGDGSLTGGTARSPGVVSGRLGAAVWLYDEPAEPGERQRHLIGLYSRYASAHLARLLELERARTHSATLTGELLPGRLPRVPGVRLAARHRTGRHGGGDWYDALPLPGAALGLAVGSVSGSGPGAVAAMGRLRASLRAYAVMEGEDPVAVLSDLELLLRLTEPARSATALFAYAEPGQSKIVLAGAGHAPPLVVGERRAEFVETTLSAPLGMLTCWEAPSVELWPAAGETVLLYTDGLLRCTGDSTDRAFGRLREAAARVPASARHDPGEVADHVLRSVLPRGWDAPGQQPDGPAHTDDIVLLAARFGTP
ncbi:PP2C family protein-serine/threonine phosphatase [Streptomyces sp. NRRL F-5135]|uniref:PP2C family protein-serine/threonine phosphatase n=1 Tax=Streptomyces sp. NRRL F-5135 TaxID=1463858 RepID=UPI00099D55B3|nr:PP2C family protein-serine/threonine phosphatase [Streptomyces sp. NRRL F-5135]